MKKDNLIPDFTGKTNDEIYEEVKRRTKGEKYIPMDEILKYFGVEIK